MLLSIFFRMSKFWFSILKLNHPFPRLNNGVDVNFIQYDFEISSKKKKKVFEK